MNNLEIFNTWAKDLKLEKRSNAVGICWQTINNAQLVNMGISPNTCENWKDMFTIESDGGFKERYYISDLMRIFFGNVNLGTIPGENTFYGITNDTKRKVQKLFRIRDEKRMDKNGDVIIFTTVGNDIHTKLAECIRNIMDKNEYEDVFVMDGGAEDRDGTCNSECEREAKERSIEARKNGKKMIFISSLMGVRSWSNKYVKNVILLYDSGTYDTTTQKWARGVTPWECHDTCYIFDFRLTYTYPTIGERYIANMLMKKEYYTGESIIESIKKIQSSDKIEFIDVYGNVDDPFRLRTLEEMKEMVLSNRDFSDYRILKNFNLDEISNPEKTVEKININQGLESENIKGDASKELKKKIKKFVNNANKNNKEENVEISEKVKYIEFIKTNGILFNPESFTKDVLKNIYNNIYNYRELIENEECLNMTFDTVKDIIYMFLKTQISNEWDKLFIWK